MTLLFSGYNPNRFQIDILDIERVYQGPSCIYLLHILFRLNSPLTSQPLVLYLIQNFAMVSEFFH